MTLVCILSLIGITIALFFCGLVVYEFLSEESDEIDKED